MPTRLGIRIIALTLSLLLYAGLSIGQILDSSYTPSISDTTFNGYFQDIESQTGIALSYSSTQFDRQSIVNINPKTYRLSEALYTIFSDFDIELVERPNRKVVIVVNGIKEDLKHISIYGIINDSNSGEELYGASIYHLGYQRGTFSNEDGYYSLSNIRRGDVVRVSYVGYQDTLIKVLDMNAENYNLSLTPNLEVSTVVIFGNTGEGLNPDSGGEILDFNGPNARLNILGEKDVLHIARQSAGVYSGSEGLGGLIVRGGSPDQNLLLLDEVPMYSVNHMADISSIFMEEATRDAELIKSGFPSRYSGRLSSVLSVHLKDGNQDQFGGAVSAGLPGVNLFLEGPLGSKTSFMTSGRVSWIDRYINPLIDKYTAFDNLKLQFYDWVGKVTHRPTNTSSISLSAYFGGDQVRLDKTTSEILEERNFNTEESTSFGWDNKLVSAKYSAVLGSKFFFTAHAGALEYEYQSRSNFSFVTESNGMEVERNDQDLVTNSKIVNYLTNFDLDYYFSPQHRIKIGGGIYNHNFSPKIQQSDVIIEEIDLSVDKDSITIGTEYSAYIEDTYTPTDALQVYAGFNYSRFNVRGVDYKYLQPRLKITFRPTDKVSMSFSGTRMVQFVHRLANNGLGISSDLWVPSTDEIAPELSDQLSVNTTTQLGKSHKLTIAAFQKNQKNIILYSDPEALFSTVLNSSNNLGFNFEGDRDWERRVEIGQRISRGVEFSLKKYVGDWRYTLSYAKGSSENRFDEINQGLAFRDQYDRPHDINISTAYQLSLRWSVGAQWVYGSGNTFTLSLEEFDSTLGISLLNTEERNNFRMPAYHHLDLQSTFDNRKNGKGLKLSLGVYNVYNRFNPYYFYLFENKVTKELVFKKLSLFPILPNIKASYSF